MLFNDLESAILKAVSSLNVTTAPTATTVNSVSVDLPLCRLFLHPCCRPRARVGYQAPRLFRDFYPRPRDLGTPWGIFTIHFRATWSSTGHLLMQSWKSHQHYRDDSPCIMPTRDDPALSFHPGGRRMFLVAKAEIYIYKVGHALGGL
jgi:hypothetical protein